MQIPRANKGEERPGGASVATDVARGQQGIESISRWRGEGGSKRGTA